MEDKGLKKYIEFLYVHLTDGGTTPNKNRKVPEILKEKIYYYFGVPEKELSKADNLGKLIEITSKYKSERSECNNDIINELEEMLSLRNNLIQNTKINSHSNFIRSNFSCRLYF
jgi:hypothetical protein